MNIWTAPATELTWHTHSQRCPHCGQLLKLGESVRVQRQTEGAGKKSRITAIFHETCYTVHRAAAKARAENRKHSQETKP